MPLDHVLIRVGVHQVDAEVAFLVGAFGHMGLKEFVRPLPSVVGLGDEQLPWLWVSGVDQDQKPFSDDDDDDSHGRGVHLALSAKDRAQVDTFYAEALKAGGKNNGAPGVRMYHPNYYAAFVTSPAGHNIEAVSHCPAA